MEGDFKEQVMCLYKEQKWEDILCLSRNETEARKLLWAWPTEENLKLIASITRKLGLIGVSSIGCGCGLFEWLLMQCTGLPVSGYEVNEEWWSSKYCNAPLISLTFDSEVLNTRYALLFCYFNNGEAFRKYIASYRGHLVFIIGPGPGVGRYTDPEPFHPNFGNHAWVLNSVQELGNMGDYIAIYTR